jgi:hypothetical protein
VSRERLVWIGIVTLLLAVGLLIGQHLASSAGEPDLSLFRPWFWENRGLDLVVQVGLIFAGALGIAALLPMGKEEDG